MPLSTEPSGPRIKGLDEKYCQECGSLILAKAEICPKCGVRQAVSQTVSQTVTSPSGRNRLAAALFALFLGGFGVHKFYLGKVGMGIFYLLFCWTFIPLIASLIEGIVYLTMTDGDFAAKYG
jgi:TM2 domain-containing membrane protein YozV